MVNHNDPVGNLVSDETVPDFTNTYNENNQTTILVHGQLHVTLELYTEGNVLIEYRVAVNRTVTSSFSTSTITSTGVVDYAVLPELKRPLFLPGDLYGRLKPMIDAASRELFLKSVGL